MPMTSDERLEALEALVSQFQDAQKNGDVATVLRLAGVLVTLLRPTA